MQRIGGGLATGFAGLGGRLGTSRWMMSAVHPAEWKASRATAFQRFEHGGVTDVAAVDDEVGMAERLECFGANQAVSIGDEANDTGPVRGVDRVRAVRINRSHTKRAGPA